MKVQDLIQPLDAAEPTDHKTVALFWGPSGTGKTLSASTWPRKILFIDADNGLLTLAHNPIGIDRVVIPIEKTKLLLTGSAQLGGKPTGLETVVEIVNALHDKKSSIYGKYQTVVLDSLSSLTMIAMEFVLWLAKHERQVPIDPGLYGREMTHVEEIVVSLVELNRRQGIHVIVTAHDRDRSIKDRFTGETKQTIITPNVTGKLSNALPMWFDECWYFQIQIGGRNQQPKYFAYIRGSAEFTAKTRLPIKGTIISPTTYEHYVEVLKGIKQEDKLDE